MGSFLTGILGDSALARVGKIVLHLDENAFYGSNTASLPLDSLNDILSKAGTILPVGKSSFPVFSMHHSAIPQK